MVAVHTDGHFDKQGLIMKTHLFRLDTINKKLLLPTLLLVTILIGALGSILVVQQSRVLGSMMESKADSVVIMLATISEQYIINYDMSALENFVKDITKDKDVAFAEYYDTDGTSLTGNVMKAPADTSHLLVYEHNIVKYQRQDDRQGQGGIRDQRTRSDVAQQHYHRGCQSCSGSRVARFWADAHHKVSGAPIKTCNRNCQTRSRRRPDPAHRSKIQG